MRVLMVCSSGGHLDQLLVLLPAPRTVRVAFATFDKPDSIGKLSGYRVYPLSWPTNRSVRRLLANTLRAITVLTRERPDVIISSGAAAAVPFFYVGRLIFRTRNIYIECIDRVELPTLTARLVRPVTQEYLCQWDAQLKDFPRRVVVGASK